MDFSTYMLIYSFIAIINNYIYIHTKAMRKEPCGFFFWKNELNQFTALVANLSAFLF